VRKQLNHTVRSIFTVTWEHVNIRSTAGLRSPTVSMKTFIYTSPPLTLDSHQGTEFTALTPRYSLFIGHFIAPLGFSFTLFHSQFLDLFTKQGKGVSGGPYVHDVAWCTTNDRPFFFFFFVHGKALMCSTACGNLFGKMYVDKSSSTSNALPRLRPLLTQAFGDGEIHVMQ